MKAQTASTAQEVLAGLVERITFPYDLSSDRDGPDYFTPRYVRAKVIYEFTNSNGRNYRGVRLHLPLEILTGGPIADPKVAAMLANPTVVYDHDDPRINMLYPFDMVEIAT